MRVGPRSEGDHGGLRARGAGPWEGARVAPGYIGAAWLFLFLFFLRVLSQALVEIFNVKFLPPVEEWRSGLLPYRILLAAQILILVVMGKVATDFSRGSGVFAEPNPSLGRRLRRVSYSYFASMVLRYGIRMMVRPEARWFSGTIPIIFHCVLASYLFVIGSYHTRRAHLN